MRNCPVAAPLERARLLFLPFACALASLSCHPRAPLPLAALDEAESNIGATSRTMALAGFRSYLVEANAAKAKSRFDAALVKDPSEPYALFGQLLMAQRDAHPERALAAALALCERAASHPLSVAGARYLFDVSGSSSAFDDQILARAGKILPGLRGDAAHLYRVAVIAIGAYRSKTPEGSTMPVAVGAATQFTLLGPFSAYHLLDFDQRIAPENTGSLEVAASGPFGTLTPRILASPDGHLNLASEGPLGDVYVLATDLEVAEPDLYVVRSSNFAPHKAYLDGTLLWQRRTFERTSSAINARAVLLTAGRHRVMIKLTKNDRPTAIALYVGKESGQPSNLRFYPAQGSAPRWSGVATAAARFSFPSARDLQQALLPEAGEALASFLAIRDGLGRDRDGAKRLMSRLWSILKGPAVAALRAEIALGDPTLSAKAANGRAARDLDTALEKDPRSVRALLLRANLLIDEGQMSEATETVKRAREAHNLIGYPVPMLEARLDLGLGLDAKAEQDALEALSLQPGVCEAHSLRYDIAKRRDAVALADRLIEQLKACPNAQVRVAEHAKSRGDLESAASAYERLLAREPGFLPNSASLASIYISQKRFDEAVKVLEAERTLWPRSASLLKHLANAYDFAGQKEEALKAREQSLLIDGSDLTLRRSLERARTGKELLEEHAIGAKKAIAIYESQQNQEDATGAYVLDAAAIRAYADGSMVDRIHIIQKVLDQTGVSELAEVSMPPGAQLLTIRTLKSDGTTLEPESIEGKETISLPGVQVGDYIEYEFFQAHPSRGPAEPGFTAANFYFQTVRLPNNWSTYVVVAPKDSGLTADPHHMKVSPPVVQGSEIVFSHQEQRVAPFLPEPNSPPSLTEYLPFVSVGAGARGNDAVITGYGDVALERAQVTAEVEEFAAAASQGKSGKAAIEAIYSAVMERLPGRDLGLSSSASATLSEGRGSRLWTMKAALEAVGIPARLAVVRTFSSDPADYLFPNEGLTPYVCLYVESAGEELWIDTLVRFAPFAALPEQATGGRDAWLLPEPGRPLAHRKTPPARVDQGKEIRLTLKLAADGTLSGSAEERYSGFEAAQIGEALEAIPPAQRNQALQTSLSRYYGGARLSSFTAEIKRKVGAPVAINYVFTAPQYARVESPRKLVLSSLTFPVRLGQRFVQVSSRRTPLYIESTETHHTVASLELPEGFSLSSPLGEAKSETEYGKFLRREKQEGNKVSIEEAYQLYMARIPMSKYDGFSRFAADLDLLQARDLTLEKR